MTLPWRQHKCADAKPQWLETGHGILIVLRHHTGTLDPAPILISNPEAYFAGNILDEVAALGEERNDVFQRRRCNGRFGRFTGIGHRYHFFKEPVRPIVLHPVSVDA